MLGLMLHETVEITLYTTKLFIRCISKVYHYFQPQPDLILIEMQELKEKIAGLEKKISKTQS